MTASLDRTFPVPVAGVKLGMRQEEFRIVARQSGLPFTDDQLAVLFDGYGKLTRMLDELGSPSDPATSPAVVFVPVAFP